MPTAVAASKNNLPTTTAAPIDRRPELQTTRPCRTLGAGPVPEERCPTTSSSTTSRQPSPKRPDNPGELHAGAPSPPLPPRLRRRLPSPPRLGRSGIEPTPPRTAPDGIGLLPQGRRRREASCRARIHPDRNTHRGCPPPAHRNPHPGRGTQRPRLPARTADHSEQGTRPDKPGGYHRGPARRIRPFGSRGQIDLDHRSSLVLVGPASLRRADLRSGQPSGTASPSVFFEHRPASLRR